MTAKTGSKHIKKVTKNTIYYNKTCKFSVKAPFSIYKTTLKQLNKHIKKVTKNTIYSNKTCKFSTKAPFSIYKTTLKQLNKTSEPKADKMSYISFWHVTSWLATCVLHLILTCR